MKPRLKLLLSGRVTAIRLPYPQTPLSAHALLIAHGVAVTDVARTHQLGRDTLVDLLRGRQKGLRGQAHRGAIALGLKPEPEIA